MMDDLRLAAVAARVVAWHNRHPLAYRISVAHVHAVGYVGLPFAAAEGTAGVADADVAASPPPTLSAEVAQAEAGSLRERALARARQQAAAAPLPPGADGAPAPSAAGAPLPALATLQPDFSENFIDPLPPRAVARFALRAGQVLARPPTDGPVRQVAADAAQPGRPSARVYLLSAVVETHTRKSRLLLGTGLAAPILGRRLLDPVRLAAVAALAGVVVGLPTWLLQPADETPAAPVAAASSPASAAASAASAVVTAGAPADAASAESAPDEVATAASASAARPASAPGVTPAMTPAMTPDVVAAAPPPEPPALQLPAQVVPGTAPLAGPPSIRPVISDADKALARQARQGGAAAPAPARPIPELAAPRAAPAASASTAAVSVYALSTRPLRTRAEAEQVEVAMRSLLRTVGAGDAKVQVLPQGEDWRVVGWPFVHRADADKARTLLVSRGMRVEVVGY